MRRSAHRSRTTVGDSGQIRLDFGAETATARAAQGGESDHDVASGSAVTRPARPEESGARPTPGLAAVILLERPRPAAGRSPAGERSAVEWFELGCELEASSTAEAQRAYRRAVETDDRHADAHLNLGRLLHEAGDLAGAERGYRRALDLQPEEATAAFNLGVVLEDLDRDQEAIAAYEQAVTRDPDFHDAYDNLVRLYERRRDQAAALRVLKRLRARKR